MKSCLHCKYAEWKHTEAGRFHPSGDGRCKYPWKMPQLPVSMYWINTEPKPWGGAISRKHDLDDHCAYFAYAEDGEDKK